MSIAEQEELLDDICNDVLGYGPLEPLLSRDDIADIMVNGAGTVFIEVAGKIQKTGIRFRDNQQLLNICQRIVSQVGRRVDESSPICDARLADGSRVNAIVPPLAIDGPALTIRKFKKDKLTLDQLVKFGAISPEGAEILQIIGRVRCNVLISGGTGSGKTTLLNCLTHYIEHDERVITCEDAAELQLQQPHVVRLETRPPNIEGEGQVTMRELVRNCLRMRPERIIVGEVRGPEAFDLLQAMNTGHDGSMGTLHANNPREALSRCESMITMGGFSLPSRTIREMICASIDVIVQAARLRDGSRRITHITEVMGMEGDTIITQDVFLYDMVGEDANGKIIGRHRSTGIGRPRFWERARYFGEEKRLAAALDAAEVVEDDVRSRMSMQTLALAFLAATAIGGLAWVFIYPSLSGERKAESRRASIARSDAPARQAEKSQRSRREQVEGSLKELDARRKKEKSVPLGMRLAQAGSGILDDPEILDRVRYFRRGRIRPRLPGRRQPARRRRDGLRHRPRPAALGAELPQEAPREGIPEGAARRRRRHRARHQGRPAAVRIDQGGGGRCARAAPQRVQAPSSKPRPSACRSARPARGCIERMPLPEANFFGIVVAIQQKSGGNLSEALGNLSKVLRDRKKMAREDPGDVDGSQGLRRHHRLAAADRDAAGLALDARLHRAAVDPSDRPVHAGLLRRLDVDRHHGDEENDQLRLLTVQP